MKALKIVATVLLSMMLFAAVLAVQVLTLAKGTALNPQFYGQPQRGAYSLLGKYAVRQICAIALKAAPAEALRTTDAAEAYNLAYKALPYGDIAAMFEQTGPAIANYMINGGELPVLSGSSGLTAAGDKLLAALLKDGAILFIPNAKKPDLQNYMPFTPPWNAQYGQWLEQKIAPYRALAGAADDILLIAGGCVVFFSAFLYMLWLRNIRPFYYIAGSLLMFDSLLMAALATSMAFFDKSIVDGVAVARLITGVESAFYSYIPDFTANLSRPFVGVFYGCALVLASFGILMYAVTKESTE